MTQLAGCVFLCLVLFLAADKAKVNSLDHPHASLVPVPNQISSDKDRVDAKNSHQTWMDRFDAALRSLLIPETVKIINAIDEKGAGHEIEAGDLEGLRLKRESENDVKMKGVSENDEKRSAGDQKKAEVKEKTKENTKEINNKENKNKEVREEKKREEKNENVGKERLEKTKTRQNLYKEENEFDTGKLRRSKFSDFKTDNRPYRSPKSERFLEIRNDEAENDEDEEEEMELENLMRQRKFKSRLARDYEDRRSRRNMKQRRQHNADGGKFPRRYLKEADDNRFYRHRRYYDRVNPFNLEGEEGPMRRNYGDDDDALGEDLRQRGRRHDDRRSRPRSRRYEENPESINENDDAMRLDDREYEGLVKRTRDLENADNEDVANIRNTRDLNDDDDEERKMRFDNEDTNSDDEQERFVRLSDDSDEEEEDVSRYDERMQKRWADDDEMAEDRRRRSQDYEEEDDDEDAHLKSRSVVYGNSQRREADDRRILKDDQFHEQPLPRGTVINSRGKRRPVWKSVKRLPIN